MSCETCLISDNCLCEKRNAEMKKPLQNKAIFTKKGTKCQLLTKKQ